MATEHIHLNFLYCAIIISLVYYFHDCFGRLLSGASVERLLVVLKMFTYELLNHFIDKDVHGIWYGFVSLFHSGFI